MASRLFCSFDLSHELLCVDAAYEVVGRTTMVMNENEAKSNYQSAVGDIISAFRSASQETTISGAAEQLEQAKEDRLNASDMADNWANRY